MRNKFSSNLLKKGLISLAAASVLASGVYASSDMGDGTTLNIFNDANISTTLDHADFNVTESIGSISTTTNVLVYITIPAGVEIMAENNDTRAGGTRWGDINISGSDLSVGNAVYIEHNDTSAWLALEYNSSSNALLIPDFNSTNVINGTVMQLDASGSADNSISDINGSQVGEVTAIDGNEFTFSLLVQDLGAPLTISLEGLQVAPASDSTSGLQNFTISSSGGEISTHSLPMINFLDGDEVAWLELNTTTTVPNINVGAGNTFADFNITLADNVISQVGAIAVQLNEGYFEDFNITVAGSTVYSYNSILISDDNKTIMLESNTSRTLQGINISGNINTSGVSTDTDIIVTFGVSETDGDYADGTTGTFGDSNGTFAGLTSSSSSVTIARVVEDGMEVELGVAGATATSSSVVVGRTYQRTEDVNISENFAGTFADEETLVLRLPTGYIWASAPTLTIIGETLATAEANQTLINSTGTNEYTVIFNTTTDRDSATATGTVKVETQSNDLETLMITGIDVNIPDSASDGEVLTLSFGGTLIEDAEISPSTIDIATIRGSAAEVENLNDITSDDLIVSLSSTIAEDEIMFAVQEMFAGVLPAGGTITATLSAGTFDTANAPTSAVDANSAGEIQLSDPSYNDNMDIAAWTIDNVSSVDDTNITFYLPEITFDESTEQVVTLTIGGTAGIVGTIDIASLKEGITFESGTFAELEKGDIDVFTGEVIFTEQINAGFTANRSFRVVSNDPNVVFTGDYQFSTKQITDTSWSTYEDATTSDTNVTTTFNQNDTLHVSIPVETDLTSNSSMGMVKYKFAVNIRPEAIDGSKTFQVRDYTDGGIGIQDTEFNLVYVGTVPALAVAETAEVDAGATTTITVTDVVGELTATSDNTDVTVSISGAIITIDASNAATGDTATITVSDDRDEEYTLAVTVNGSTVDDGTTETGATSADITDLGQTADETKLNVVLKNDGVTQNADGSLNVADKMTVTITDTGITVEATQEDYTVTSVEVKEGTAPTSRAVVTETEYIQISDDKYLEVTLEKTVPDMATTPALVAGWNLLGNASNASQAVSKDGVSITWTYADATSWVQDGDVPAHQGFWAKADADIAGYAFANDGDGTAMPTFEVNKWSLLSSTEVTKTLADVLTDGATIGWTFKGATWYNAIDDATTELPVGQGYWVK